MLMNDKKVTNIHKQTNKQSRKQRGTLEKHSNGFQIAVMYYGADKTESIHVVKDRLSCFVIDLPSCVCKKGKISSYCVTIPQ